MFWLLLLKLVLWFNIFSLKWRFLFMLFNFEFSFFRVKWRVCYCFLRLLGEINEMMF